MNDIATSATRFTRRRRHRRHRRRSVFISLDASNVSLFYCFTFSYKISILYASHAIVFVSDKCTPSSPYCISSNFATINPAAGVLH